MKLASLVAIAFALAASAAACRRETSAPQDAAATPARPTSTTADGGARPQRSAPVVVTIVVDQLAAWIAAERFPLLPPEGGFARLLREGTYVRSLRYAHAVTDTAPGHAALHTGAVPREHGIFGNELVTAQGEVVSVLRDEKTTVVYPNAIDPPVSSSPSRMRIETIADRLRASSPDAFIVSLSLKDRGALIPGGKTPTAAVWLDTRQARFVTSSAIAKALPPWVEARGDQASVLRALGVPWERTWRGDVKTPDDQRGEGDESGVGTTFPHLLRAVTAPGRAFRTLPAADETLLGLALDALDFDRAQSGERKTLVALSLSTNDYVGHVFGPDSVEAWDELARLDRALGAFLRELDHRYGETGWGLVLSGDHGTINMPEVTAVPGVRAWCHSDAGSDRWQRPCGVSHRVDLEDMTGALVDAAQRVLPGKRDLVRGTADPYVFVGEGARSLSAAERTKLDRAIRSVLEKTPGVRRVLAVDGLPAACPAPEGDDALTETARIEALVCRSVLARDEHAGAYYVVLEPGSFFDPRIVRGFGTSHGSPYLYDRTVPLVVRSPRARRGQTVDETVDFRAFARTTSALLGIEPPSAARAGRDLSGAR